MTTYGTGQGPVVERRPADGPQVYEYQEGRGVCTACWAEVDAATDDAGQPQRRGGHLVATEHRKPAIGGGPCTGSGQTMWPAKAD